MRLNPKMFVGRKRKRISRKKFGREINESAREALDMSLFGNDEQVFSV